MSVTVGKNVFIFFFLFSDDALIVRNIYIDSLIVFFCDTLASIPVVSVPP